MALPAAPAPSAARCHRVRVAKSEVLTWRDPRAPVVTEATLRLVTGGWRGGDALVFDWRGESFVVDCGATDLDGADGLYAKGRGGDARKLGVSSAWIRLPSGERSPAGDVVETKPLHRMKLTMLTTDLDFGEGIDGLLAMSGIARLEREHGLQISFVDKTLTFANPPVRLLGLHSPAKSKVAAHTLLRRLTEWTPVGFARSWERALRREKLSHAAPEDAAEAKDVFCRSELLEDERCEEARERERKLKDEYADVFKTELPRAPRHQDQLDTLVRLPPVGPAEPRPSHAAMHAKIPQTEEQKQFIARMLDALKEKGILRPCESPFNAPMFCVDKDREHQNPDKHYRVVMNFKPVNQMFPRMPTFFDKINDILVDLSRCKWIAAADLTAGFHQIAVHPSDQQY